jgi:hypothetical protein
MPKIKRYVSVAAFNAANSGLPSNWRGGTSPYNLFFAECIEY